MSGADKQVVPHTKPGLEQDRASLQWGLPLGAVMLTSPPPWR